MPLLLEQGEEIDFILCMCSRNCIIIIAIFNIIVYTIFFILFCYTKLRTDPHINQDFDWYKSSLSDYDEPT